MARTKSRFQAKKATEKRLAEKALSAGEPDQKKSEDDGKSTGEIIDKEVEENVADEVQANDPVATVESKAVKRSQPARSNSKTQKKPKVDIEEDEEEQSEEEPKETSPKRPSKKQRNKKTKAQQQSPKPAAVKQLQKKKASSPAASKPKTQLTNKKIKS